MYNFTAKQYAQTSERNRVLLDNLNKAYLAIQALPEDFNGKHQISLQLRSEIDLVISKITGDKL